MAVGSRKQLVRPLPWKPLSDERGGSLDYRCDRSTVVKPSEFNYHTTHSLKSGGCKLDVYPHVGG